MRRFAFICSCLILLACNKNEGSQPPVQSQQMEAIVLDLELADAYANSPGQPSPDSLAQVYRAAVLDKHKLSEKEYKENLDWYYQHPAALDSVYTHVRNKLEGMKE